LSDARSGAATTLFTLRRSPRHCLLLCVGESRSGDGREGLEAIAAAVQAAYPELIDVFVAAASDALRQRYGVSAPTGVLIRPDGYIGYYGQPIESERLLAYLSSYLVCGGRAGVPPARPARSAFGVQRSVRVGKRGAPLFGRPLRATTRGMPRRLHASRPPPER